MESRGRPIDLRFFRFFDFEPATVEGREDTEGAAVALGQFMRGDKDVVMKGMRGNAQTIAYPFIAPYRKGCVIEIEVERGGAGLGCDLWQHLMWQSGGNPQL